MAKRVNLARARRHRAFDRQSTLGYHDDGGIVAGEAALDEPAHFFNLKRTFGYQDYICPTRHARVQGDPARVTSHDLDDEHSVVALRRRVKAVDCLGGDHDGGVKAERIVGPHQVVVDRLWHSD